MVNTDQMQALLDNGGVVVDNDGDKVGKIGQVYLDDQSGDPEWVTVKTGLFGTSETFVPLSSADIQENEIRVPFDKATIKDAPRMDDAEGHLSPEQESELFRYYSVDGNSDTRDHETVVAGDHDGEHRGTKDHVDMDGTDTRDGEFEHSEATHGTDGVVEEGRPRDHDHNDDGMVLSEEQLRVGTEKVETGKARLRKYVVTENVTKTVPVEREEVRLEREPIAEGDTVGADGDIGDAEQEVVLTEERVVVSKESVPVERVSLDTETVTDHEEVNEEVRKEEVEADIPDATDTSRDDR